MCRKILFLPIVLALVFAGGCSDSIVPPDEQSQLPTLSNKFGPWRSVSVLDWNIYVGTDVDAVIGALANSDSTDDVPALIHAIGVLQNTAFPLRAQAIVDVIEHREPDVIGLQEVSDIDINLIPLGLPVFVDLNFLDILEAELLARGLNYVAAAQVVNVEAVPFPGISLVDRDVLLVNADRVTVLSSAGDNYGNNIGVVAPGVDLKRGWVSVEAEINGRVMTFVNTHLESGPGAQLSNLRAAQASELMTLLGTTNPVILMGDLNDEDDSLMYQVVTGAGFVDVWSAVRPMEGLTCCHEKDLSNSQETFDQRLDYILARGIPDEEFKAWIERVGMMPGERLPGPAYVIWPSDHAGLMAVFRFDP